MHNLPVGLLLITGSTSSSGLAQVTEITFPKSSLEAFGSVSDALVNLKWRDSNLRCAATLLSETDRDDTATEAK